MNDSNNPLQVFFIQELLNLCQNTNGPLYVDMYSWRINEYIFEKETQTTVLKFWRSGSPVKSESEIPPTFTNNVNASKA